MQENPDDYSADTPHNGHHEEKVHEVARLIGGYIRNVVQGIGVANFVGIVYPDEFPTEVRATVEAIKQGATDDRIRRDPYLSFAFPLLQTENTQTISEELVARSSEIALYATGDFTYAQKVREYVQIMQAEHQVVAQ